MRRPFQPLNINWALLGVCVGSSVYAYVCSRQIKTQTKTGFPFDIFQMLLWLLLLPPPHILFCEIDKIFFNLIHKHIVCLLIFYILIPSFFSCMLGLSECGKLFGCGHGYVISVILIRPVLARNRSTVVHALRGRIWVAVNRQLFITFYIAHSAFTRETRERRDRCNKFSIELHVLLFFILFFNILCTDEYTTYDVILNKS